MKNPLKQVKAYLGLGAGLVLAVGFVAPIGVAWMAAEELGLRRLAKALERTGDSSIEALFYLVPMTDEQEE